MASTRLKFVNSIDLPHTWCHEFKQMVVQVSEVKAPASPLPLDLALDFHILFPQPMLPGLYVTLLNAEGEVSRSFPIVPR